MSDAELTDQSVASLAPRLDTLATALAALEKQMSRAGREQLKANALAETQAKRFDATLDELRTVAEQREQESAAERERLAATVSEARLTVVRSFFPVLDGLDEAIRTADTILHQAHRAESPEALLLRLLEDPVGCAELGLPSVPLQEALESWLQGLVIVRRRLLDAMASEGVTPILAEGRPFDPHHHIVVEVIHSRTAPAGMVLQETRRGLMIGTRVLRHAEVAVADESSS
ncbi:nucleotide exchange factor GrpE [Candidatus Chloroploca sp. Khr17]|uniref:nucleotide exchange factor GrpE n=1 Tax=Candidatus Chloroploca sp. Khr17 TaxID=2496869 RepID=UPI00101DBA01|nr:nucleotide exchange factor GrpE [Candidatus Chloroploca sp. Khr17]